MPQHRTPFINAIKQTFPELASKLNAQKGQLHFEMDVLRKYVERAISNHTQAVVLRAFEIADSFYRDGNASLRNAIDVSFVEPIDFSGANTWAWELLPADLQKLHIDFHGTSGRFSAHPR